MIGACAEKRKPFLYNENSEATQGFCYKSKNIY